MATDWYDIKYLESATNIRALTLRSTGRAPSASIAREISVCLQQGRNFFEAAEAAPLQIKPLQVYYGILAFAQAIVVARRGASLSTLKRGHGLRDVTPNALSVEDLTLRFENAGTFQEFNHAIAPLGRIWYFDNYMPRWLKKPFDFAADLHGKQITIKDILSRMPDLHKKFQQTFDTPSKTLPIMLHFAPKGGLCTLRIDDPELFTDRASLIGLVQKLRTAHPFLTRWRFSEASHAWGYSILQFDNAENGDDDLSDENLVQESEVAFVGGRATPVAQSLVSVTELLPPLSGGYVNASTYAMQPLAGVTLPEHSLQVLGSFLLSSLVRYRPQVWQKAVSRSETSQGKADDRSLSLIEAFLDGVLAVFPQMVVRVIDYQRTE